MPKKLFGTYTLPTLVQERPGTWGRCIHHDACFNASRPPTCARA